MRHSRSFVLLATFLILGLTSGPAAAISIDFTGFSGGSLSYPGGFTTITGADLPISQVFGIPPGSSSSTSISGGALNFETGIYTSGISTGGDTFISIYGAGGSLEITGAVPAAGIGSVSPLLSATFSTPAIFAYSGFGIGSLSGGLDVSFIEPLLTTYFGFFPFQGVGSIAQVDLNVLFGAGTPGPGSGFSATQGSVNVIAATPEPVSLLLLGSGLVGLAFFGRKHLFSAAPRVGSRSVGA